MLISISLHVAYIFICNSLRSLHEYACIRITFHVLYYLVDIFISTSLHDSYVHHYSLYIHMRVYVLRFMYTYCDSCIILYGAYRYIYIILCSYDAYIHIYKSLLIYTYTLILLIYTYRCIRINFHVFYGVSHISISAFGIYSYLYHCTLYAQPC